MTAKILLAEDEDVLRMLVVDSLEDEGYEIDEACDGSEALEYVRKYDYDLILMDYMMPGMTGLDVIKEIRKMPEKQRVKIMMLSAKSQKSDQEQVLQEGANYFMAKPFSPLALVHRIEEILSEDK
ncbi:response regulator [Bacillus benzoevorans]|uniref:CheY-like chemotaxis protein n=1 Tax=Bacillus benzoevorans TaxID=1456 RepID=A0A7X0HR28_9BACI|nr:response regulator [Bacillus benzoevorans]MBB6444006.1 CheY-like chemotaxis protein [Bacillus benzoevorans]